jgi:3-hydroxyacyl-CoA dehydrogenase
MRQPIRTIAVIGTGVIGASWTALFLAKGLKVVATEIADNAEASRGAGFRSTRERCSVAVRASTR